MIRNHREFDNHEFVIALTDQASGLKAFVAIHDRTLGYALGGTRMKVYENEDQALADVLDLSKAMSYKSALAGLPYGGGKAVIMLPKESPNRDAILRAYAEKIELLHGLFRTGTDVGVSDEDTVLMGKYCHYILGVSEPDYHGYSTSKTAAIGVYNAIKAAAKFKYGSDDLHGKSVAIKGLGKLGGDLAAALHEDGATIYAADINPAQTEALQAKYPDVHIVDVADIHKQKVDIYAPCALGHEFSVDSVKELACDIVAGGANNQLVTDQAGDELHARGILYAPDYIANAGGLIFVSDELDKGGFQLDRVLQRAKAIQQTLQMIFERAAKENAPTYQVADAIAREKIGREAA